MTIFMRGDMVRPAADPRHLGRVEWVNGLRVGVRWCETRWLSTCRPSDLQRDGAETKRQGP